MKRFFSIVISLAVPALLFLNAWQGWRYNSLSDEVVGLEKRQKELLEANRDAAAQIARELSPEIVEERAVKDSSLAPIDQSRITRVIVEGTNGRERNP